MVNTLMADNYFVSHHLSDQSVPSYSHSVFAKRFVYGDCVIRVNS